MGAVKGAAKPQAEKSELFRSLSAVFLINSMAFAKATPTEQTAVLLQTQGKTVQFVDSFYSLRNAKKIFERLMNGEDVSTELEFNEVKLSDAEKATVKAVAPVIAKIKAIKGGYPWLSGEPTTNISFPSDGKKIRRGNHSIGSVTAKRIWDQASRFWVDSNKPASMSVTVDGYHRQVEFSADGVKIGCQDVPRIDVEFIAKHFGWEPNVVG